MTDELLPRRPTKSPIDNLHRELIELAKTSRRTRALLDKQLGMLEKELNKTTDMKTRLSAIDTIVTALRNVGANMSNFARVLHAAGQSDQAKVEEEENVTDEILVDKLVGRDFGS